MDSENKKSAPINTEFHKEPSQLERKGESMRIEHYLSSLQLKLEKLDQVDAKLTSIKKDINDLYLKLDEMDGKPDKKHSLDVTKNGSNLLEGWVNSGQSSLEYKKILNKIEQNQISIAELEEQLVSLNQLGNRLYAKSQSDDSIDQKLIDLETITQKLDTLEIVNDKLTDLLEVTQNAQKVGTSAENSTLLVEEVTREFQVLQRQIRVLAEASKQLKAFDLINQKLDTLAEVKSQLQELNKVDETLDTLADMKEQLKALDIIDGKLDMLDQISKRLSAMEAVNAGLSATAILYATKETANASEENTISKTSDALEENTFSETSEVLEENTFSETSDAFEEEKLNESGVFDEEIAEEDKPLLLQIYEKLALLDEIIARLDVLEEINSRLDMLEEIDEQINYIREFLDDKLDLDYVAMYETLREEVHEDAIKTYRNIQAVIVEENAKQNHVLFGVDGNQDKLKFRMNHVMFFSIISFVTSILVMLLQILPALGIKLF